MLNGYPEDRRLQKSQIIDSVTVGLIGVGAYVLLRAINYDSNGIGMARELDLGHTPGPNHMLFEAGGFITTQVAGLFDHAGPSFSILLILSAVFGGIALGATNLAARRAGAGRLEAMAAAAWLGTTYAFWKWSTNVAYVSMAAMVVALALSQLWEKMSPRKLVVIGITGALSALAWEANLFLLPVLIVGIGLQVKSCREWLRASLYLFAGWAGTLGLAYGYLFYQWSLPSVRSALQFMVTWGGGNPGPTWGHWRWGRIGDLARTWIQSVIGSAALQPAWFFAHPLRLNTTLPRLAPIVLAILFVVPLIVFLRRWIDPIGLFFLFGAAAYIPFLVWWDPFETKWLLVPNVFVALFLARFWSSLATKRARAARTILVLAVAALGLSNVAVYGIPEHTRESQPQKAADCVAARLQPADLYLDPEWDFSSLMAYKYGRNRLDLIALLLQLKLSKPKMLHALEAQVRSAQASDGEVYISDPLTRHFALLNEWGVTSADLDGFLPGRLAFACEGWQIRRIDRLP